MLQTIGRFLADAFGIDRLRESYRAMGNPLLFWWTVLCTFAWIGVFSWLMMAAEWPGSCDHEGRRLWGLIKAMGCSPDLLAGGPKEIGLFLMLWSLPAVVVAACIGRLVYELKKRAK